MPINDEYIGAKLKEARIALGLTLDDVAQKVGWNSYQILSNIEQGKRAIKVSELTRLCKIYYKEMGYFIDENYPVVSTNISWRARLKGDDCLESQGKIREIYENYGLLENMTGEKSELLIEKCTAVDEAKPFEFAETLAKEVGDKFKLGFRPSSNLVDALETNGGIRLLFIDLADGISAAAMTGNYGDMLFVNHSESPWRRNFNMAHELFHILTSKVFKLPQFDDPDREQKPVHEKMADAFASALLIPRDTLYAELKKLIKDKKIQLIDLINLAIAFEVSTQALLWRLCHFNILAKQVVDDLLSSDDFNNQNREKRILNNCPEKLFSRRFVRLGLKAFNEGKISKGKLCSIFNTTRAELSDFVRSWGFEEEYLIDSQIQTDNT